MAQFSAAKRRLREKQQNHLFNHKEHGEHGGENEVWQQVEVGVFFVSACNLLRVLRVLRLHCALLSEAAMRPSMI